MSAPKNEPVEEVEAPPPKYAKPKKSKKGLIIFGSIAALFVLGGGGYFVWATYLDTPPPPPPRPVAKAPPKPVVTTPAGGTAPAVAPGQTPVPVTSSAAVKTATAGPATPSDKLNELAHAPVNAINKAQDAVKQRRLSDQARIDEITNGTDTPEKPPAPKPAAPASAKLSPGISATTSDVEAVADSTPAFRSFVANAKITGVIVGTPGKIILNGRLARAGDLVDPGLGITFDNIDGERKLLVFKDKTGAVVTKKY